MIKSFTLKVLFADFSFPWLKTLLFEWREKSAIKEREENDENIVRFYEVNGEHIDLELKLFGKAIKTKVLHNELKTFTEENEEVNLIEW